MIAALALLITAVPSAHAWEAGVEGGLCTLTHDEDAVSVRLTFDPTVPLYTITLTAQDPWPISPEFAMQFNGSQPLTIRTGRHVLSPDRLSLSVSDRGFGNVLDGLQFNATAQGLSGPASVAISLDGAAPEVAAFRSCGQVPTA
ncbi:hypothetical protein V8J83_13725 [Gymnodinialimonas sp. 2307UL20-7]